MGGDAPRRQARISRQQCHGHGRQRGVLTIGVGGFVFALEFDANREIITAVLAAKQRLAGMPGSHGKGHELDEFTITSNQQVRGNLQAANSGEVGMRIPVQRIGEQGLDLRAAEIARRQADTVDDQQFGNSPVRPVITVGARAQPGRRNQPAVDVYPVLSANQWLPNGRGTTIVVVGKAGCQRNMALTRLFINGAISSGAAVHLDDEQTRYLGRVLRLRAGDALTVFNGDDGEFAATLCSIGKHSATVVVDSHIDTATESPLKVHLVQGVSRGERMDYVIQKATELGVKRISPVFAHLGVVRLDTKRAAKRRAHWQRVAENACEQSGRIRPPLIDNPIPINDWFGAKSSDADLDLILLPRAATALTSLPAPQTKVCLLIGPEGGFTHEEYEGALAAGIRAVSLGPRILRTETAAAAAIAVVQSMWGDLRRRD